MDYRLKRFVGVFVLVFVATPSMHENPHWPEWAYYFMVCFGAFFLVAGWDKPAPPMSERSAGE